MPGLPTASEGLAGPLFHDLKNLILSHSMYHILEKINGNRSYFSNGLWYCSFWSEGTITLLNLKILVVNFVPRDLEWQHNVGLQMTAWWDLECQLPAALQFEIPAPQFKVLLCCHSRSHVALASFKNTPLTKTSDTTPHYYPKYKVSAIDFFGNCNNSTSNGLQYTLSVTQS